MCFLRLAPIGALLFIMILFAEHINTQRHKIHLATYQAAGNCPKITWNVPSMRGKSYENNWVKASVGL